MILYFAGQGTHGQFQASDYIEYKLYSYYNEPKQARQWPNVLLLDSGAFSAFTKNAKISVDSYVDFVLDCKPKYAIQLDVIGDDEGTWANWKKEQNKITTMPVIHYQSDKRHIERVLDAADYICLGGLVPYATKREKLIAWLDYLYSYKALRQKKVHTLGVNQQIILERYPVYSCDSSSWLAGVMYRRPYFYRQQRGTRDKFYLANIRRNNAQLNYQEASLYPKDNYDILKDAVRQMLKYERYITNLWKHRGFDFPCHSDKYYDQLLKTNA